MCVCVCVCVWCVSMCEAGNAMKGTQNIDKMANDELKSLDAKQIYQYLPVSD